MFIEIGSYDAKTKLPELLRQVQAGRRYTITLRGKPVADLIPSEQARRADTLSAVAAMRALPKVQDIDPEMIAEWIAEVPRTSSERPSQVRAWPPSSLRSSRRTTQSSSRMVTRAPGASLCCMGES
jgi:prevent-host-death family protein